ncbi:hypothetical protein HNR62_000287 [Oceanisphaera litoralis]|uniref:lytic transglycosylase domain-containing protein n=1 Tax=Oceanisphaera litoralis TaxID=225144 RepID=UPI001956E8B8|nr:lytic transglycosylase domain-containing protein [Oceanisphaera litoralis]MBM7454458.1 hypothetical protein [Oceanisphaera litoralis]
MDLHQLQRDLKDLGLYTGLVDGVWGSKSQSAYESLLGSAKGNPVREDDPDSIAWGARVSAEFRRRVRDISRFLAIHPNWLMACMAFESGRSFRSDIINGAGSGAVGLIQFMPATAKGLGTTTAALSAMLPEDQLDYVQRYFAPYAGRLKNLGDVYMAILWPNGVGRSDDFALWSRDNRPVTYRQNAGLDADKDGVITRGEALGKISALLAEGLRPSNRG